MSNYGAIQGREVDPESAGVDDNAGAQHRFILNIYGLLSLQLMLVTALAAPYQFVADWFDNHKQANTASWILFVVIFLVMQATPKDVLSRVRAPWNYGLLFLVTCALAFMIGSHHLVLGAGIAAVVFFVFAAGVSHELLNIDGWKPFVVCLRWTILVVGVVLLRYSVIAVLLFAGYEIRLDVLFEAIGALVFNMYAILETKLAISDAIQKRMDESIEDHVLVVLKVYFQVFDFVGRIVKYMSSRSPPGPQTPTP